MVSISYNVGEILVLEFAFSERWLVNLCSISPYMAAEL